MARVVNIKLGFIDFQRVFNIFLKFCLDLELFEKNKIDILHTQETRLSTILLITRYVNKN